MSQEAGILFLVSPLVIGIIIAAFNSEGVNNSTEKVESWIRRNQKTISVKKSWYSKYLLNPVLFAIVKFSDWTDGFLHRGIKNGIRVSITLYLIFLWLYLLYTLFMIAVMLLITAIVLYIIFKVLINSNDDVRHDYNTGRRIMGSSGSGQRVNPQTGIIQKKGFLGWNDTNKRINPDTGVIQDKGLFGWNDSETRINQETGNIQSKSLFGYNDSDVRINPETGVIQKKGLFNWEDTEERVNPETGRHQKKGLFGWEDD